MDNKPSNINMRISPDFNNLNYMNRLFKWIPSEENIRPKDDILYRKYIDSLVSKIIYASYVDQVYILIFNLDYEFNENIKLVAKNTHQCKLKVFVKNKYPYDLPESTRHYIMWYSCTKDNLTDVIINQDIKESLYELLDHNNFEFVWYENPKMSIPDIYHVQVFWHII